MKLPRIPLPKLSSLPLPFLKGRKRAEDDDATGLGELGDDLDGDGLGDSDAADSGPGGGLDGGLDGGPDGDEAPEKKERGARLKKIGGLVLVGFLGLTIIGGTGGLFGWIFINAEETTEKRNLMRPQLTVSILAEGEAPNTNSSSTANVPEDASEKADEGPTPVETAMPTDGVSLNPVDPTLHEERDDLILPIIAVDGREPWSTYARPFDPSDPRPRLALLVVNLGLDTEMTRVAIESLPPAVTLSFSPYAPNLPAQLEKARMAGHEVMIDLPLEPLDFPRDDPGPRTLLTSLPTVENLNRLEWVLGQAPGYVGVATWMGSQFTTVEDAMMPILESIKERGLLFLDARDSSRSLASELASSIQLPRVYNNSFIDAVPSRASIDRSMQGLELTSKQQDYAIGIARPLPLTLSRLEAWVPALEARGIAVAPVSSLADRQRLR